MGLQWGTNAPTLTQISERTGPLALRLSEAVQTALKKAAADDGNRSAASLMEKVLSDWLVEKGYLRKKGGKSNGNNGNGNGGRGG